MVYIYARVSTEGQTVESQLTSVLSKYPEAKVVSETASGAKNRPVLDGLINSLVDGDTLVVAALDRLGRRAWKAIKLIEDLYARGITVISVREGIDYSTTGGRLITNVLLSVAQSERDLISERTKAGLARAKAEGKHIGRRIGAPIRNLKPLGRPKRVTEDQLATARLLRSRGLTLAQIGTILKVSAARVCQLVNQEPALASV